MKKIDGIIFDMDGVITDTEKWLQRYYLKAAEELGFTKIKAEHILEIRSLPAEIAEKKMKSLVCDDFDFYAVRELRKKYMSEHIEKYGLEKKKGIDELLRYIKKKGLKCSVATATPAERTKEYLTRLGIISYFDEIVCADMVEKGKPEPDIYIEAAKRLGLPEASCIALEDSPNGVLSAYRAGCVTVMVPDLTQPDEKTSELIYAKADSLLDVIDIISKINGDRSRCFEKTELIL